MKLPYCLLNKRNAGQFFFPKENSATLGKYSLGMVTLFATSLQLAIFSAVQSSAVALSSILPAAVAWEIVLP